MAATFDPYDKASWYFGSMSRQDATDLLMGEKEGGVFLVRDSNTIHGDFVLCVREDSKVSHYIINKIQQGDQTRYRIGDQMFPDLPACLQFYKLHYLDTTPLIRPAPRRVEKVQAKYDFEGSDQDDLPFKKGEILTIVSKDEDQWWTARNSLGRMGSIPVPYVQKYDDNQQCLTDGQRPSSGGGNPVLQQEATIRRTNIQEGRGGDVTLAMSAVNHFRPPGDGTVSESALGEGRVDVGHPLIARSAHDKRKLPAYARVKQARVPNAYDKTALKLEVGDIIKVTKMNINGQWEGELNGKVGHFPFTHVEFVDAENNTGSDAS